jgi:3-hydroxyisobutyrate dehydrogenase-like beta-hydroxyacid dehydrogenase
VKALNAEQGSATKAELKVIFAKYAAAYKEAIASLKKITFPPPVQADVVQLITTYSTLAGEASKLAANPDHNPGSAITDASVQAHLLGTRIRAALGLPPPPNL